MKILDVFGFFLFIGILYIMGMLLWVLFIKNSLQLKICGPSQSIHRHMAQATVEELNNQNLLKKNLKLEKLINLSYELISCKKEIIKTNHLNDVQQECSFKNGDDQYVIKWDYKEIEEEGAKDTYLDKDSNIYISIREDELNKSDFTEINYTIKRNNIQEKQGMGRVGNKRWEISSEPFLMRTNESTGFCHFSIFKIG